MWFLQSGIVKIKSTEYLFLCRAVALYRLTDAQIALLLRWPAGAGRVICSADGETFFCILVWQTRVNWLRGDRTQQA